MKNEKDIKKESSGVVDKTKKIVFENKKILVIIIVALAFILCGVLFFNNSNEKKLIQNMEALGKSFYEEYYYPSQAAVQKDLPKFLSKFEKSGIRINLKNISKLSRTDKKLIKKMVNSKTNKKCDFNKSYVVIYPEKPFKKDSYKLKVNLDCGF